VPRLASLAMCAAEVRCQLQSRTQEMASDGLPGFRMHATRVLVLLCAVPVAQGWCLAGLSGPAASVAVLGGGCCSQSAASRRPARAALAGALRMSQGQGEAKEPLHPATIAAQTTGVGAEMQYDGVVPAIYPASTYLRYAGAQREAHGQPEAMHW
jgi:hypothetical protein